MRNKDLEIKQLTAKILERIGVKKPANSTETLIETVNIFKYLVKEINPNIRNSRAMSARSRKEAYQNEILAGLMENKGLPTTNSIVFNHLLNQIGIENYIAILKSRTGGNHVASLVKVEDEYQYFDITLERSNYEQQFQKVKDFPVSFAALGKEDYERIYKPVKIMASATEDVTAQIMPKIAKKTISKSYINNLKKQNVHPNMQQSCVTTIEVNRKDYNNRENEL